MKKFAILLLLCALSLQAQSNSGEIRLKVTDPSGLGVKTPVHVSSEANQYRQSCKQTTRAISFCSGSPSAFILWQSNKQALLPSPRSSPSLLPFPSVTPFSSN
jgi:hypothetical protein